MCSYSVTSSGSALSPLELNTSPRMHCYLTPSLNHYSTGKHTHTHTHTTHTVPRLQPRFAQPSLPHCIAGPPTLSLSLGTTAVQRCCKSAALRVPALQGVTNLLQYLAVTQTEVLSISLLIAKHSFVLLKFNIFFLN